VGGAVTAVRVVTDEAIPHRQRTVDIALLVESIVATVTKPRRSARDSGAHLILFQVTFQALLSVPGTVPRRSELVAAQGTLAVEDLAFPEKVLFLRNFDAIDSILKLEPGGKHSLLHLEMELGAVETHREVGPREPGCPADEGQTILMDHCPFERGNYFNARTVLSVLAMAGQAEFAPEVRDPQTATRHLRHFMAARIVAGDAGRAALGVERKNCADLFAARRKAGMTPPVFTSTVAFSAHRGIIRGNTSVWRGKFPAGLSNAGSTPRFGVQVSLPGNRSSGYI